ncbi:MAG: hypothetical protein NTX65_05665 [Ignavibacteriales bacterium]|nr:hypothetical protein [Ignavibacteriales bacterium]
MNRFKVGLFCVMILCFFSCKEDINQTDSEIYPLKVYPIVISNQNNTGIDELYNSYARPEICNQFIKYYPDSLDKSYQTVLLKYARKNVVSLSLDLDIFNKCLEAARINNNNDTCFYPLYFEDGIFNGKEVWNFGCVYEIDFKIVKFMDVYSVSVEKKTLKVVNVQNYLPLKPEVRISNINYDTLSVVRAFSATKAADDFRKIYKNIYYWKLRAKMDESILNSVDSLKENKAEFQECFNSANKIFTMWTLPCLVESARFMNKDVWIIEVVYGAGDYGHYFYTVIDKGTHELIFADGCL